jgi:hypothetical protein
VVAAGEVWVPVHPAMARALQRSTIIITMILHCIPENASWCYIMLALVKVPYSKKNCKKIFHKPGLRMYILFVLMIQYGTKHAGSDRIVPTFFL